eukprot:comp24324_c1_seq18/m.45886 comp24324_c1_seq18/g.45886  ORF comp24324_c1_seq18/g.45886 comp24324_c1_seq18/m.45886 type:complete len:617 (+) comp24324_c1_seq18:217-2067(+)
MLRWGTVATYYVHLSMSPLNLNGCLSSITKSQLHTYYTPENIALAFAAALCPVAGLVLGQGEQECTPFPLLGLMVEVLDTLAAGHTEKALAHTDAEELAGHPGEQGVTHVGVDEGGGNDTDEDHGGNPVVVDIVHVEGTLAVLGNLVLVDGVEGKTTGHTDEGPGREDDTVKGTDVLDTELVGKEGGDQTEPTTVAGRQEPHADAEGPERAIHNHGGGSQRNDGLEDQGHHEEGLAAEEVGAQTHENTAGKIEARVDGHDGGGEVSVLAELKLADIGQLGDGQQTGNGVGHQHDVHQAVVPREHGLDQRHLDLGLVQHLGLAVVVNVHGGSHGAVATLLVTLEGSGGGLLGRAVAVLVDELVAELGLHGEDEVLRGRAQNEGAHKGEPPVDGAEDDEGEGHTLGLDEQVLHLGGNHGPATEAAHGHAGHNTTVVGEPLLEGRHGGDVGQTETNTAEDTEADVQQPVHALPAGQGSQHVGNPVERAREEQGLAGTLALQPGTEDSSRGAKAADGHVEGVGSQTEVFTLGLVVDNLHAGIDGPVVHGPGVEGAGAHLHKDGSRDQHQAVERNEAQKLALTLLLSGGPALGRVGVVPHKPFSELAKHVCGGGSDFTLKG